MDPYPLERLKRTDTMPNLNAVPASKLLDFRALETPHALVNAMGEYQAMMDAIREGVVNKTPATAPSDLVERSNHLKAFGEPKYVSGVVEGPTDDKESDIDAVLGLGGNTNGENALYDQAVGIVIKDRKCSTSYIQRKLAIGYNKAARLVEQMEDQGLVSAANHVGKREILIPEHV